MEKVKIFGVEIFNITSDECENILRQFLKSEKLNKIFTPNTEIVMAAKRDEELKNLVNSADLVLCDGIGLIHASKMRNKPIKERVTGFDTSIKLLEIADEKGLNLYFLGGKEGVAKEAKEKVEEKYKNLKVVGYHNGYFNSKIDGKEDTSEEKKIIEEINSKDTDIVFVGFGFPRQEKWIDKMGDDIKAKVIIGNGGVLDILSGRANRAPDIFIKLGLEWFYRLIKDPARIKRQIDLPKFLLAVLRDKNSVE
ncbi:WecB/TagA/CpsF family glycosyltransferase [Peptoniphilus sp.]|jgi:N-acetylglucosaminyldiphosphoundecaprenol N-acetyl-beta-D-mannosaminyltransferase|uniref:WecB/TagA/CpsF family glycosyltransferase n=1 Tax=Peptoniphilus sp. TaxID=1971214 RepID=UPI003D8EDA9E